jgi:hypothetical protein
MPRRVTSDRKRKELKASAQLAGDLRIPATLFDDETVRVLIDEWIVPALVDQFLQWHNGLPSSDSSNDNGGKS